MPTEVKADFAHAQLAVDWTAEATVLEVTFYTRPSCLDGLRVDQRYKLRLVDHFVSHIPHLATAAATTVRRRLPRRSARIDGQEEEGLNHPYPPPAPVNFPSDSLPDLRIPLHCFVSLLGLGLSVAEYDLLLAHIRTTDLVISGPGLLVKLRNRLRRARMKLAQTAAGAQA